MDNLERCWIAKKSDFLNLRPELFLGLVLHFRIKELDFFGCHSAKAIDFGRKMDPVLKRPVKIKRLLDDFLNSLDFFKALIFFLVLLDFEDSFRNDISRVIDTGNLGLELIKLRSVSLRRRTQARILFSSSDRQ